ncbi:DUF2157 domain-containing protein [Marinifilum sp. N1E240]|uniref:DUF2157 domain-containing protein n=1 Tax=Marinifilum sp. N1E240 TaxID=2608082 RepID=UPI00128B6C28|nr:DUF2157 domain-containing protein [Marinifilum sp. N1E240]MPQ48648.1 DUF2157 domain-containing protein [Marinifilum sp. N1E240]
MNLNKELPKLVKEGVISQEVSDSIFNYYQKEKTPDQSRLMLVFGVIGAILVGLGIILIIAHNWDDFLRPLKTGFALLPLIIGQLACGYTILRKKESPAWREASTSFLFFAIGSCISLISQIYNIPGEMGSFLFLWLILFLPIPFVMKSSVSSLLFLIGSSFYALNIGYWEFPDTPPYWYLFFIAVTLIFYLQLKKQKPESNALVFHNWLIPISLTICLGSFSIHHEEILFLAYMSMFAIFTQIGNTESLLNQPARNNAFRIIGWLGSVTILLILSFDAVWEDIRREIYQNSELITAPEVYTTLLVSIAAIFLAYRAFAKNKLRINEILFFVLLLIYILSSHSSFAFVLVNLLLFTFGLLTIISGTNQRSLMLMNSGLLIITALIICRFFDTDLSFVIRGVLFLSIGFGFFIANYQLLKKKK